jgi:hypothetical protein
MNQMDAVELTQIALGDKPGYGNYPKIEAIRLLRANGVRATCADYPAVGYDGPHFDISYHAPDSLGLKDAKDMIEDWMELVQEYRDMKAGKTLTQVLAPKNNLEDELYEERKASRVTEKSLGKALSQVTGLKEKVADRNWRLQMMANENRELRERVRQLEALIADRALADNLIQGMGF